MADENGKVESGWCKLYTADGVLVTLPVTVAPLDYAAMISNVRAMLAAGFLVNAPGVEPGETKEDIGYVVRRSKDSRDGGQVPVLDLYPANDGAHFAILSVYLNTPEERAAFEAASGMSLARMPEYIGDNKIERGKSRKTDELVIKAPRPFGVVYAANPKYDEQAAAAAKGRGEVYPVPRRKFVRWAGQAATPPAAEQPRAKVNTESSAVDESIVREVVKWLSNDPAVQEINLFLPKLSAMDKYTKRAVWNAITDHAKRACLDFDRNTNTFVAPIDVAGAF